MIGRKLVLEGALRCFTSSNYYRKSPLLRLHPGDGSPFGSGHPPLGAGTCMMDLELRFGGDGGRGARQPSREGGPKGGRVGDRWGEGCLVIHWNWPDLLNLSSGITGLFGPRGGWDSVRRNEEVQSCYSGAGVLGGQEQCYRQPLKRQNVCPLQVCLGGWVGG